MGFVLGLILSDCYFSNSFLFDLWLACTPNLRFVELFSLIGYLPVVFFLRGSSRFLAFWRLAICAFLWCEPGFDFAIFRADDLLLYVLGLFYVE